MTTDKIYIYSTIAALRISCDLECPSTSDATLRESAVIPVEVDWSISGLNVTETKSDEDDVHRISLRLFPTDGSEPFERYMESNLYEGSIEVPVGSYSVVVLNEAISDPYWSGAMIFTDVDQYDLFSAELHTDDGSTAAETYALVAWSLGTFEVTQSMADYTRGVSGATLTEDEEQYMVSLTNVIMEPLTRTLNVNVTTENLASSQSVTATISGLSQRVNIVTGASEVSPIAHTFDLDNYSYDEATRSDTSTSGVVSGSRLCFAHADDHEDGYTLDLEIYLSDGTQHIDEEQLSAIDVEGQITSSDSDYLIEHSISLPEIDGGSIELEDWADGGTIELN